MKRKKVPSVGTAPFLLLKAVSKGGALTCLQGFAYTVDTMEAGRQPSATGNPATGDGAVRAFAWAMHGSLRKRFDLI